MIVITGGGTGGHLSIAKSIATEYNSRGIKPVYIGSTKGQDKTWFENSPLFSKTYFLDSYGVVNQGFFGKFKSFFNILKLSLHVRNIFKENDITKVFSVGGYSSAPASIAAVKSRIPLYIHEQNAIMGKLNKILKPFAKEIFCSFNQTSKAKNYPVSKDWFDIKKEHDSIKTIAFLGGSQGAKFINNLALETALSLKKNGIKIVHQTGKNEFEAIKNFYMQNDINADVFDFFSPLSKKFKDVDFAISRCGAGSIWELCAAGIPTLFIPYPHAAKDHQYHNAKTLKDKNACLVLRENSIDKYILLDTLKKLDLTLTCKNLNSLIQENGAKEIVDIIEKNKT